VDSAVDDEPAVAEIDVVQVQVGDVLAAGGVDGG
jgi:hypothetical protein